MPNRVRRWTLSGVGLTFLMAMTAYTGGQLDAMSRDQRTAVVFGSMIVGGVVARGIARKRFAPDTEIGSSDTQRVIRRFHRDAEINRNRLKR